VNQVAKLAIPPSGQENGRTAGQELNHRKVLGRGKILKGQTREIASAV